MATTAGDNNVAPVNNADDADDSARSEESGAEPRDSDRNPKRFDPLRDGLVRTDRYAASTTALVNGPAHADEKHRTYVIIGNGRGGTSMVAGVAHYLGLELNPGGGNFEDGDFVRGAQGLSRMGPPVPLNMSPEEITEHLRQIVRSRNSEHDVWGWKDPSAERYLPQLIGHLRNPHLILVWRDPAAIATARIAGGLTSEEAFRVTLSKINRFMDLAEMTKWPTLMVSYERGRLKPEELAAEMAEFLGMELTEEKLEKIVEFVSPKGGYLVRPGGLAKQRTAEEQKAFFEELKAQKQRIAAEQRRRAEEQANTPVITPAPSSDIPPAVQPGESKEQRSKPQSYISELEARLNSQRSDYEAQRQADERQRVEYQSYIAELEARLNSQQEQYETQRKLDEKQRVEYQSYVSELEARLNSQQEQYETQRQLDEKQRDDYRGYILELEERLKSNSGGAEQANEEYRTYIAELERRLAAQESGTALSRLKSFRSSRQ